MATLTKGYYHCLECGALFEAVLKDPSDQRCSVCGNPPTGKIFSETEKDQPTRQSESNRELKPRAAGKLHGVNQDTQDIYEATMATISAQKESRNGRVKRTKRREKKGGRGVMLVGVWLVLMFSVVGLVKYFGEPDSDSVTDVGDEEEEARMLATREKKSRLIIEAAVPACEKVMMQFFAAPSAASKSQYVYHSVKLSGVMSRYYRDALSFSASASKVKIVRAELLRGFSTRTIGALCINEQGLKWEAVFVLDGNEWKLDWKSLVRYDAQSWSLFPAGDEGAEGEFRLYLRVRDSNEDLEQKEMSLVFYKPTMYIKDEFRGLASAPVRVLIDSDLGREIAKLVVLDKERENSKEMIQDPHGLKIIYMDPSRYHRVRVKMALHKVGKDLNKPQMELLEILANDWYGDELKSETTVEDSSPTTKQPEE